ncbi:rRNA N(6)-adenosine-methyltransferase ZCCHC4-like [Antedon mediterranea]|uniref:rRNA N(6)-adenosine-methyltransferase ZCCHC4-like n=1 Tax=Antedon mediterranea TaxID=105859 RepID=UPI003AF81FF1
MPSSIGYDVVFEGYDSSMAPTCPHGPTLLFEKICPNSAKISRFFACSASRDRKHCKFYQDFNEVVSDDELKKREIFNKNQQPKYDHLESVERLIKLQNVPEKERIFCKSCYKLLLQSERKNHNKKHELQTGLTLDQLSKPSELLIPLENNSTNAQYLFSRKATEFILDTVQHLGYERVLCVGAPRIHEAIQNDKRKKLESLLLDIDHRYVQFYPPDKYCRYNMFNNHFFDGKKSRDICCAFLQRNNGRGVILVTDPPFGGLIDVLVTTMKYLQETWRRAIETGKESVELPVFWIFPYFFEPRILQSWPTFTMLDYKVDYENHDFFKSGPNSKSKKKGSPVRIFTNISSNLIPLPAEEGYSFCSICNRYVSKENKHCNLCNSCTSKDGTTYRHCDECNRCVKPVRIHCKTCKQCMLPNHRCNDLKSGCYICGEMNHKHRYCPHRGKKFGGKKRNFDSLLNDPGETLVKQNTEQASSKQKMSDTNDADFQETTSLKNNSEQTPCYNKDDYVSIKKNSVNITKVGQRSRTAFVNVSKRPIKHKVSASKRFRRKKILQFSLVKIRTDNNTSVSTIL